MRLPEKLQVGPVLYSVLPAVPDLLDEDNRSLRGSCNYDAATISIGTACKPARVADTFMHEVLHAVADAAGVTLSEETIGAFAPTLLDTLQRNGLLAACWEQDE